VTIGGSPRTPPFTYTLATPTGQVAFDTARQGGAGTPVTVPFTVVDGCGPWSTFVGGGSQAWELPVSGRVVDAGDGRPLTGATVQVEGTGLVATTGGDGSFTIASVPKGRRVLRIVAAGFLGDARAIDVGNTPSFTVGLYRPSTADVPTATGSNVLAAPDSSAGPGVQGASILFETVSQPGTTTFGREDLGSRTPVPSAQGTPLGGGFVLSTTATVTGSITLALPYEPSALVGMDPSQIRMLRLENGIWVDRTMRVDTAARVVHGQVPIVGASRIGGETRPSSVGSELYTLVSNLTRAIEVPPAPLQGAPAPGRVIVLIPGISLPCGSSLFSVSRFLWSVCEVTDASSLAVPFSARQRARVETFSRIVERLGASGITEGTLDGTSMLYGGSIRYISYSSDFRSSGRYLPADTRRHIEVSADILHQQIRTWGTEGRRYDIVAHSLGGAVAAFWLFKYWNTPEARSVHSITTFDSPVRGIDGPLPPSAELLGLGGDAVSDLQNSTKAMILAGARLGKLATISNQADRFLPPSWSWVQESCPSYLTCLFNADTSDPVDHSSILAYEPALVTLDQIRTGGMIRGTILKSTGGPAAGARIDVDNHTLSAIADANGAYQIDHAPLGNQELVITGSAFQTKRVSVIVGPHGVTPADATVTPSHVLAFSVQPVGAQIGMPFSTQPVVVVRDGNGVPATTFTGAVTLAIKSGGAAGAQLSGATTVNATNGVATFTGLSIDKAGTGYVLIASIPGVASVDSTSFTVSPAVISATWAQLAPVGASPSGRVAHTGVWDPSNDQMLVFAGQGGPAFDYLNELWAFRASSNQWSQLIPSNAMPPVRREHAAAWDSTNGRMLVFGGNNFTHLNDLWAYSPATNSWSQLNPSAPQPAPRAAHSALWDPTSQQFLVYGGHNGQYLGDLWAYSATTNSWTQRGLTGPSPGLRAFHTTIWDPAGNRLLLFAGQNDTGQLTDVWAYQSQTDTWNLLSPTNATPPIDGRAGHTAVWDDQNGQMVVFGGFTPAGYVNTVLIFRPAANAWSRPIASGSVPASRDNHAAVWDPVNRRMLVFSGFTGGAPPDLWSFTP